MCPQALPEGSRAGEAGNFLGETIRFACFLTNYSQTKQMQSAFPSENSIIQRFPSKSLKASFAWVLVTRLVKRKQRVQKPRD
jgi:hypothetical protein